MLAESEHALVDAVGAGDGFVVTHLVDAQPRLIRLGRDGSDRGPIDVAGGALIGLDAHPGQDEVFVGLSSVTSPTQSFRVDFATGEVTALPELVLGADRTFTPPAIRVERRAATSDDGTPVPYFLIMPADADLSRPQPTLMWGYGGFKIPLLADYRPGWSGWLAAGGLLAIANLRGGGEFGTDWYEAGRLERKQNVFDDFIAVAEHLVESGVTTAGQLAIHGRSNGGLLVGAVMTQRPDLIAAAIPAVGVLDMLRFHLFTVGAAWIPEYGNPDDPEQFETALAYSPLHQVRVGHGLSGHARPHRRSRRPGRAVAQPQVHRGAAARPGRRPPDPDPDRGGHRPRHGETVGPGRRRMGRPPRLRRPPHGPSATHLGAPGTSVSGAE